MLVSFWKTMFSYHFVSLLILLGLPLMLRNQKQIDYSIILIYIFFILNSIVSALQFNNSSIGWLIANFLNPIFSSDVEETLSTGGSTLGQSLCAGLLSTSVLNGYFSPTYLPLVTTQIYGKKTKERIFAYTMILVGSFTIFFIQQRMAIIALGAYLLFLIYKRIIPKIIILVMLIGSFFIFFGNYDVDFSEDKYGRSFAFFENNETRENIFLDIQTYISSEKALFGGFQHYKDTHNDVRQHNTFLDVITKDGLFGLIFFVLFFFEVVKYCFKTIRTSNNKYAVQCAFGVLLYLLYSQTHSSGIQSGIPFFWFLLALITAINNIAKKTEKI